MKRNRRRKIFEDSTKILSMDPLRMFSNIELSQQWLPDDNHNQKEKERKKERKKEEGRSCFFKTLCEFFTDDTEIQPSRKWIPDNN